jgi:hypothetical protein
METRSAPIGLLRIPFLFTIAGGMAGIAEVAQLALRDILVDPATSIFISVGRLALFGLLVGILSFALLPLSKAFVPKSYQKLRPLVLPLLAGVLSLVAFLLGWHKRPATPIQVATWGVLFAFSIYPLLLRFAQPKAFPLRVLYALLLLFAGWAALNEDVGGLRGTYPSLAVLLLGGCVALWTGALGLLLPAGKKTRVALPLIAMLAIACNLIGTIPTSLLASSDRVRVMDRLFAVILPQPADITIDPSTDKDPLQRPPSADPERAREAWREPDEQAWRTQPGRDRDVGLRNRSHGQLTRSGRIAKVTEIRLPSVHLDDGHRVRR